MEWTLVTLGAAALAALVIWIARLRSALGHARRSERRAVERRDRFLVEGAGELRAPLSALRAEVAALSPRADDLARVNAIARALDDADALVAQAAELPRAPRPVELEELDLAELVREIVSAPPFSDRGPPVMLRARPALVHADRARLVAGLRVLLWVVRRDVDAHSSLVITVSGDSERALVELDAHGGRALVEAFEREPAVGYGLAAAASPPGVTLALRVASEVARAHGGRLSAAARAGAGRFVLELPAG